MRAGTIQFYVAVFLTAVISATPISGRSATLTFQQGVNSYAATADTTIRRDLPTNQFSTANNLFVGPGTGAAFGQGLLRFDDIFGSGSNQISPTASIFSARLILHSTANPSTNVVRLHRMLRPWAATDTWSTFDTGIAADDLEAASLVDAAFTPLAANGTITLNITPALHTWANGVTNNGWAILPTGPDGWSMDSSEAATLGNRPMLVVDFNADGSAAPLGIISQPPSQNVSWKTNVTFTVSVTGSPPTYLWFRNSQAIPGATNHGFTITNVQFSDAGTYHVLISNSVSSVTSSSATLTVTFPNIPPLALITESNAWRFNQQNIDLGTSWKETNYDDSAWQSGPGVLGFPSNETLPGGVIRTVLNMFGPPPNSGQIKTYYFRTRFMFTNDPVEVTLTLSNVIDDGAVFYLNGKEIGRVGMPAGTITWQTDSDRGSEAITTGFEPIVLSPFQLLPGENVLAVEVHQRGVGSSDLVFGTTLWMKQAGPLATITRQPQTQFGIVGSPATLDLDVSGARPLFFQWTKNGSPVPGATNQNLTISNVSVFDGGIYAALITNSINSVTSSPATLIVLTTPLLDFVASSNRWKYHGLGQNLGSAWRANAYVDTNWAEGRGLFSEGFYFHPESTYTVLPFNTNFFPMVTYYFRTRFFAPLTRTGATLVFQFLLDDGAVFYLNGLELFRIRMPSSGITYNTLATSSPLNGTEYEVVAVQNIPLLPGENVLAVEVHQASTTSEDVAFVTRMFASAGTNEPASITFEPANVSVPLGYPATLTAAAFGAGPLHLQWFKDGAPVLAATNSVLRFAAANLADSGSYELQVSNLYNTVLSRAALLTVIADSNPPVRLVRGPYLQNGTTNSVVVRWRTSDLAQSRVLFGTNLSELNVGPSNSTLKIDHELQLTNLTPNTRYYYAVGTTVSNLASGDSLSFLTPPAVAKPTRIWAQGDSGTATTAARAVVNAFTNFNGGQSPDVWLMLGDNAYPVGSDEDYQAAVFDFVPDLLRRTLLWTTIGNHETYSVNAAGRYPYRDIVSPPVRGEAGGVPSGNKLYYSFDYGNIHFVCLDSEVSSRATNGPMATWLREDLAANTKDWLIAFWHSPPYSKGSHDSDSFFDSGGTLVEMRENIVPILESFGVDLVLCGHSHVYERSFLLDGHYGYSPTLNASMLKDAGTGHDSGTGAYRKTSTGPAPREGAVYVVAGSSGYATFGTLDHPAMAVSFLRMGSVVIDVNSNRLDALFLRETGAVDDRFTILKGAAPESLRIATFRMSGNKVYGAWKSVAGRRYEVQASPAIHGPSWQAVGDIIAATGATSFWTNGVVSDAALFFRVRELSP